MHELDAPPWLRVESTLMATARTIRQAYDCALTPFDLNLNTASTLAYLAENGPVTQTVLADRLGIGRAATGTYVDRLEQRGLIERLADAADRRVWLVSATDAGRELAGEVAVIDERLRTRLRKGIGRSERQALAQVLIRLQENLEGSRHPDLDSTTPNTARSGSNTQSTPPRPTPAGADQPETSGDRS